RIAHPGPVPAPFAVRGLALRAVVAGGRGAAPDVAGPADACRLPAVDVGVDDGCPRHVVQGDLIADAQPPRSALPGHARQLSVRPWRPGFREPREDRRAVADRRWRCAPDAPGGDAPAAPAGAGGG